MLLGVGAVGAFHNYIGLDKASVHIAPAQVIFQQPVGGGVPLAVGKAAEGVGVDNRRVRGQRGHRIGDDGQFGVLDLHQFCGGLGLLCRLRHDDRQVIRFPAHSLGLFRAARSAEDGLVGQDQPVFVHRHICRSEDRDDTGRGQRSDCVDTGDVGVGAGRVDNRQPRLPRQVDVPGVGRPSRHFVHSVAALDAAANCSHRNTLTWTSQSQRRICIHG